MADISALLSSKSDRWFTPPDMVEEVRTFYGGDYFDPCPALPEGEPLVDGLAIPWYGKGLVNPPFKKRAPVGPWVQKFLHEPMDECLLLVPNNTGTRWFQPLWDLPILFIRGRLHYSQSRNTATFDSVLAYRGPRVATFVRTFGHRGVLASRVPERDISDLGWPAPPARRPSRARRVAVVQASHAPLPIPWDITTERTA